MGYSHRFERKQKLPKHKFAKVVEDFRKLMPIFKDLGIKLADGEGKDDPVVTEEEIWFNGLKNCGHEKRNLGIAWPSKDASGVCFAYKKGQALQIQTELIQNLSGAGWECGVHEPLALGDSDVSGLWYAGCEIKTRTCDGDCSHESFCLPRVLSQEDIDFKRRVRSRNPGNYYLEYCKTAYKP